MLAKTTRWILTFIFFAVLALLIVSYLNSKGPTLKTLHEMSGLVFPDDAQKLAFNRNQVGLQDIDLEFVISGAEKKFAERFCMLNERVIRADTSEKLVVDSCKGSFVANRNLSVSFKTVACTVEVRMTGN